ncbi:MAG: tRNA guanosine(34) transglycosylase Tgt [bacterium]|nr:tRNA guanosine(34) transglycosylase Tgt [bacterium]
MSNFSKKKQRGSARRGELTTAHGTLQTPFFMPIATKGAVKNLSSHDMKELVGSQILLSNTYHLMLRPGMEVMKKMGGLHKLMNWDGPMLTDSGGYQVFSLSRTNKTKEEGVTFNSHIDGERIHLTPELSMQMQKAIGADMIMQFDDVAAGDSHFNRYKQAMERSLRWAKRCRDEFDRIHEPEDPRMLFGIVQGGTHEKLREESAQGLMDIGFDGYAIGGLSVGEKREDAYRITKHIAAKLPEDQPRYFMGGGMPEEIVAYVQMGVDMFDCVIPSRNARHGTIFAWNQDPSTIDWSKYQEPNPEELFYDKIRITNQEFQLDEKPIDAHCKCHTCQTASRSYIRHLFTVNESLAHRLSTIHNVHFYMTLMKSLRDWIEQGE